MQRHHVPLLHAWGKVVRVVRVKVAHHLSHVVTTQALLMTYSTVLVLQQECLELDNLFAQLGALRRQSVVLLRKNFDLGLEVGQPLLLSLPTLKSSDPV